MTRSTYAEFAQAVEAAGLTPKQCQQDPAHWQIWGGKRHHLVNVWPHAKRGFGMAVSGDRRKAGNVERAIQLAGPRPENLDSEPAPWEDKPSRPEHIGLIRLLCRALVWLLW